MIKNKTKEKRDEVKIDVSGKQKAIMVSRLCNNRCLMCHSDTNVLPEHPTQKILKALEDRLDGYEENIQLSGGEPTLRKDLPEILHKIKKESPDAKIQINSNGRMFKYPKFTEKISPHIDSVMTELHGPEETHDDITQVKGSFRQTVKGIKELLKRDVQVYIVILVNNLNHRYLPELTKFIKTNFKNHLDKIRLSFNYTWFVKHAKENRDKLFVKVSECAQYLQESADILEDNISFMHFPLCIFDRRYRKYVIRQKFVMDKREDYPIKGCHSCNLKEDCGGIWTNYKDYVDELDEVRPQS